MAYGKFKDVNNKSYISSQTHSVHTKNHPNQFNKYSSEKSMENHSKQVKQGSNLNLKWVKLTYARNSSHLALTVIFMISQIIHVVNAVVKQKSELQCASVKSVGCLKNILAIIFNKNSQQDQPIAIVADRLELSLLPFV